MQDDLSPLLHFSGVPRNELEERIFALVAELRATRMTLQASQEAGTRLHNRVVALGLELKAAHEAWPHWQCRDCSAFNGEAKEKILKCRACGAERPT